MLYMKCGSMFGKTKVLISGAELQNKVLLFDVITSLVSMDIWGRNRSKVREHVTSRRAIVVR
jgi:hypothetical protein